MLGLPVGMQQLRQQQHLGLLGAAVAAWDQPIALLSPHCQKLTGRCQVGHPPTEKRSTICVCSFGIDFVLKLLQCGGMLILCIFQMQLQKHSSASRKLHIAT